MAGSLPLIHVSWPIALGCLLAVGLAGLLRGFTGFGFGLAATPLLSLLIPPAELVPIVLLLQVASSFIGFGHSLEHHDRRSTWWLGLSAVLERFSAELNH